MGRSSDYLYFQIRKLKFREVIQLPKVTQLGMAGAASPRTLGSGPSWFLLPWPEHRIPPPPTFTSQAAERAQALESHLPRPKSPCLPSNLSANPIAVPAPGVLGRPLTRHTDYVALGQIPHPWAWGSFTCWQLSGTGPSWSWTQDLHPPRKTPPQTPGSISGAPTVYLALCRLGLGQFLAATEASGATQRASTAIYKGGLP